MILKPLKLNLQHFAEGDAPTGDVDPQNQQQQTDPTTSQANESKEGDETKNPDNQLNEDDIKRLHESEMLKSLGVTDFNQLKQSLEKFREIEDSQKTEAQKQKERMEELETNFTNTKEENANLQAKLSAYTAGVKAESVDDVIILAKAFVTDDTDINAAIEKVIAKYPQFGSADPQGTPAPSFVSPPPKDQSDGKPNAFAQALGIKQ